MIQFLIHATYSYLWPTESYPIVQSYDSNNYEAGNWMTLIDAFEIIGAKMDCVDQHAFFDRWTQLKSSKKFEMTDDPTFSSYIAS